MGRTVKGKSFGLGWPHCPGPPRPWKPVRSPSDVRPARPDGCASLRTVCRQLYRRPALAPHSGRIDRPSGRHPHPAKTRLMLAVLGSRLSSAEPRSCIGQAHLIYDVGQVGPVTTTDRDEDIRIAATNQHAKRHACRSYRVKRRCPGGQPCLRPCAGLRWRKRHAARTLRTRGGHPRTFGAASS